MKQVFSILKKHFHVIFKGQLIQLHHFNVNVITLIVQFMSLWHQTMLNLGKFSTDFTQFTRITRNDCEKNNIALLT